MSTYNQLIARARHLVVSGVLLGITLQSACGAGSTGITTPGSSGGIPSALVGSWNEAAASGSQYCDPNGGGCTSAYGGSETYTFGADGTFVYSQLLEANLYGCIIKTFLYATGTLTVNGARLTLYAEVRAQPGQQDVRPQHRRAADARPVELRLARSSCRRRIRGIVSHLVGRRGSRTVRATVAETIPGSIAAAGAR